LDLFSTATDILAIAIPVLIAITSHEAAHGFVANRLGDDTAYRLGRVTFNPFRHIDAFGTVLLPALLWLSFHFLFGWAKPVPVDFSRLNRPRRDMVLVAAAGPGVHLLLALASGLLLNLTSLLPNSAVGEWLVGVFTISIVVNVILAVFNMLPLPPLDGGRVAVGLLPDRLAFPLARLERWGLPIIIAVVFLIPWLAAQVGLGYNVSVFSRVIIPIVQFVVDIIGAITGTQIAL
jgi:Zn-dependent protease